MLKTPTRQSTAQRRALAVSACEVWVLAHGHATLTPSGVARLLNVSPSWVSRRLGSRRDILLEVARVMTQIALASLADIPPSLEPQEHLRCVVQAIMPRRPVSELGHAWGLLEATDFLSSGPAFYALADALVPLMGRHSVGCAAAWAGVLGHYAKSATPWTRRDLIAELYAVAQGFRGWALAEAGL